MDSDEIMTGQTGKITQQPNRYRDLRRVEYSTTMTRLQRPYISACACIYQAIEQDVSWWCKYPDNGAQV